MTAAHLDAIRGLNRQLAEYAQQHPHLQPFAVLADETEENRVLSDRAAKLWEEIARARPNDPLALHHLAIVHHGRAYQGYADVAGSHQKSLPHWREALHCWLKLVRHDAFWAHLKDQWSKRAEQKGEMLAQRLVKIDLDEFRRQLPPHLIKVHVTIIQDTWRKHSQVARDHFQLILSAPFDPELISQARSGLYSAIVGDVPQQLKDLEFQTARTSLEGYLAIDPQYVQALADRLQVTVAEWSRIGTFQQTVARFQADETFANRLMPFASGGGAVSRSESFTAAAAISEFYFHFALTYVKATEGDHVSGEAKLGHFCTAASLFAKAYEFERGSQKALGQLEQCGFISALLSARLECKQAEVERLQADCARRLPASPVPHLMRALLQRGSGNMSAARASLQTAKDLHARRPDESVSELVSLAERELNEPNPLALTLIKKGMEAFEKHLFPLARDQFQLALHELTEPSEMRMIVLTRIAQCQFICQEKSEARRTLREAEQLYVRFPLPGFDEQLRELRNLL